MKRLLIRTLSCCLVLSACGGESQPTSTSIESRPNTTPEVAFAELVEALEAGEPERTAALTDPLQIPLLVIAEGVQARQVADLTAADRTLVAVNFWKGFAEQLSSSLGAGFAQLQSGELGRVEVAGSQFAVVDLVLPADASARRLVFRDTDEGWVVDLIASFPSPLLGLIPDAAQAIRASRDAELSETLRTYEASVRFVLADDEIDPRLNQAATAALEAIVR